MSLKDSPDLPASILIGEIYLTDNKQNPEKLKSEGIPIIENFISLNPSDFFKRAAERLLVQIYITLNELDNAKDLVDKLTKTNPDDANTLVSKSRVYRLLGDSKTADEALNKAESLINKDTNYFDILAVADEDYYVGKFSAASKLYEKITDSTVDNEITRRLIDSYLKAGNNQKVLQICQSIRTNQGLVRNIVKLEISLHEDIGDLVTAKKLCKEFLDSHPSDVGMELHLVRIHYRAQELDEVDKFLKKPVDYEKLSMEQWIFYGELLSVRGLNKEAIIVMYEARRKFFDRSEAHLQYVNTFLRSEKGLDEWLHPEEVSTNTAVSLEENNIKTWYVIEDRDDADFAKNELNPKNPLCKKLLGKKAGDEIELVSTGPQKRNGKITEIRSKYVLAFQNSMSSYQTMFPDAEGLYRIDLKTSSEEQVNEDDLKIIFEQIDKHHERDSQIVDFYRDGKLTIGAFAKLLGKNPIEAWGLLMGENSPGIRCSAGDVNSRAAAQEALKENSKIVIDILSLLTIHGLEVADLLVKVLGKPLVAQSTVDVITELLTNRKGLYDEKGFMTMGKQGDQYVREEISAEQIGKNSEYLKGILDWIKDNCIITPCHEALKMDSSQREKLYDIFGVSFIDTVLIAKQENALLYSEDERLRTYAATTYKTQGIWIQAILEHLLNTGSLSNDQYQEAVIKLVNSGYFFISINADTLIAATKKSNWKPDSSFLKLVSLLDGKTCDSVPAVIVVSHYIEQLLNQPIFLDDPKNLCFVVLDNATNNREHKKQFIKSLELRVKQLLRFSPSKLQEFNQILSSWLKFKIL